MASRFWVAAGGTWDGSTTANWSATSGGAGGASVPTAADDVFFDAGSGTGTVSTSGTTLDVCRSLNFSGYTGAFTFAASTTIIVGDSGAPAGAIALKLVAGMGTVTAGAGSLISFVSTNATTQTITTGGKTIPGYTIAGAGSNYQLSDGNVTAGTVTLTSGGLNTNGQTCSWGIFSSNNTNTRSLTLGASAITVSGTGSAWNMAQTGGLTFSCGTSTITLSGAGVTLNVAGTSGSALTFYAVSMTGSGSSQVVGANTFTNLTRTGTAVKTDALLLAANLTVTGTLTLTGASLVNRLFVQSSAVATSRSLTAAAVSLSNVDIQDVHAAGAAAPFSGTSVGDGLGNASITFTASTTRYAVAAGNWSSTATWASSSGGTPGASVPLPQDAVVLDGSSGAGTYSTDMPRLGANVACTGFTATLATVTGVINTIFGNLTLAAGMTFTPGTTSMSLAGRGSQTLTSASKNVVGTGGQLSVTGGGNYTVQDDLTITGSVGLALGTFTATTQNVTAASFLSNVAGTRALNMGSGTWTLTGTGTVWGIFATGLTLSAQTSTLVVSDTSSTQKTIQGTATLNNVTIPAGGSGAINFNTGNITFAGTLTVAGPKTLVFASGLTYPITGQASVVGSSGNLVTISATTPGSSFAITKAAGLIAADWLSLKDSTASGGAVFSAGANSTNVSGNSGWTFSAANINAIMSVTGGDASAAAATKGTSATLAITAGDSGLVAWAKAALSAITSSDGGGPALTSLKSALSAVALSDGGLQVIASLKSAAAAVGAAGGGGGGGYGLKGALSGATASAGASLVATWIKGASSVVASHDGGSPLVIIARVVAATLRITGGGLDYALGHQHHAMKLPTRAVVRAVRAMAAVVADPRVAFIYQNPRVARVTANIKKIVILTSNPD